MRQAKLLLNQQEEERKMQGPKMNAYSRKLLEKRQQRGESQAVAEGMQDGDKIVNGQIVKLEVSKPAERTTRRTAKSVPTG